MSSQRPNDETTRQATSDLTGQLDLEQYLTRFERAWQGGSEPQICDFLPGDEEIKPPAKREAIVEFVKIDLEYRWQLATTDVSRSYGQRRTQDGLPARPRLEDYLTHLPDLGPVSQIPLSLIEWEFRVRKRWGDRPSLSSYAERFADQGQQLLTRLADADHLVVCGCLGKVGEQASAE